MITATTYEHIELDSHRGAVISGAGMKVVELVLDYVAYGWSPEELHFQHPHLSLGQIHSALAYYWDHRAEMDADMARRLADVATVREQAKPAEIAKRLRRSI